MIVRSLMVSGIGGTCSMRLFFYQLNETQKLVQIASIEVAQLLVTLEIVRGGSFILVAQYVITARWLLSHETWLLAFTISLLKERKQVFSHEDHLLLFRLCLPFIVAKPSILVVTVGANFLEQHGWHLATYLDRCLCEGQHIFDAVEVCKHVSVQATTVLFLDPLIVLEQILRVAVKALHLLLVK